MLFHKAAFIGEVVILSSLSPVGTSLFSSCTCTLKCIHCLAHGRIPITISCNQIYLKINWGRGERGVTGKWCVMLEKSWKSKQGLVSHSTSSIKCHLGENNLHLQVPLFPPSERDVDIFSTWVLLKCK